MCGKENVAGVFDPYHRWLGIPPSEQPPDHYRLLGLVRYESDPEVIENAANQRMAHLRSFQTSRHAAQSQKLLNEVAAARVCLLNPDKKADYDERLRLVETPLPVSAAPPPLASTTPLPPPARSRRLVLFLPLRAWMESWMERLSSPGPPLAPQSVGIAAPAPGVLGESWWPWQEPLPLCSP